MRDLGHWTTQLILEDTAELPYGFVYQITNLIDNRKYIGKKQCLTVKKRPPLKGKKNKRCETVETDWKIYTSSSNELNNDIKKHGIKNFSFEILKWCCSKWELSYNEARLQFINEVLLSNEYYNGIINLRIGKKPKNIL
jgi:hypothetical protein